MKKLFFALIILISIVACKRHITEKAVVAAPTDNEIKIPSPGGDFIDVDIDKNDFFRSKIFDNHYILNLFADGYDYRKYQTGKLDSNLIFKIISVGYDKDNLSKEISAEDYYSYNGLMKSEIKDLMRKKLKYIQIPNNKKKSGFTDDDIKELEMIKHICSDSNAYSILSPTYIIENSKYYKVYFTREFLKIKNKMICVNIMCENNGPDSKKWITDITKKYIKTILDANK